MRVEIWTMVLWMAAALVADAVSFAVPSTHQTPLAPRIVGAVIAAGAATVLIVLGKRTPSWFLHALLVTAIGFMIWFVAATDSTSMTLSAMLIMLIIAGYTAYTMPLRAAFIYVTISAAGLYCILAFLGRLELLFLPWGILTAMAYVQILVLGVVMSNLQQQVVIDPLTGLLNRAGLALATAGADGKDASSSPRSVLVLDLDNFKAINDQFGHVEGDRVLAEVGQTIMDVCRTGDIGIRCGGDEFILILPDTDVPSAESLAARLRREVAASCSTGVSVWAADEPIHHAIARADKAMYRLKAERRGPTTHAAENR